MTKASLCCLSSSVQAIPLYCLTSICSLENKVIYWFLYYMYNLWGLFSQIKESSNALKCVFPPSICGGNVDDADKEMGKIRNNFKKLFTQFSYNLKSKINLHFNKSIKTHYYTVFMIKTKRCDQGLLQWESLFSLSLFNTASNQLKELM